MTKGGERSATVNVKEEDLNMKKMLAMILSLVLALTMVPAALAEEDVTTVTFWHTRGSGANYECVTHAVETFNATIGAETGVKVEEVFIGSYNDIITKTQLAVQTEDAPDLVVMGNTFVSYLIEDGLAVDMMPYTESTGFDTANIADAFMQIYGNTDGSLYSLPYIRSTPVFFYNKTMLDEAGLELGDTITIDELVSVCSQMTKKADNGETDVYGFEMLNDFGYFNAAFIQQLGSAFVTEDGSPCLEDGVMLKVMSDWKQWVDDGWCRSFDSTNAGDAMKELFYQNKLFSFVYSSSGMTDILAKSAEAGIELGVCTFPTYDAANSVAEIGGGNICMIENGKSDEQKAATWSFVNFLMSDEEVYFNAKTSGYVPCTKSVAENEDMQAFWAENPTYEIPYQQMLNSGVCQEYPYVEWLQEYTQLCMDNVSLLIQDGSITAEEALENIIAESEGLW